MPVAAAIYAIVGILIEVGAAYVNYKNKNAELLFPGMVREYQFKRVVVITDSCTFSFNERVVNMLNKIFNISKFFLLFFAILAFIMMIKSRNGNYLLYSNIINIIAFISLILFGIKEFQNNRKKSAILLFVVSLLLLALSIYNIFLREELTVMNSLI